MSPDRAGFRLLCEAARGARADRVEMARLAAIAPPGEDFVRAATLQKVVGPVLGALSICDPGVVPPESLAVLRRRTAQRRALAQAAELLRLIAAFEAAGIRVLVLKGVPLSMRLYGDPAGRRTGDIDLLVEPGRLDEADAVLRLAGYDPLSGSRRVPLLKQDKDLLYRTKEGGLVELHHRLTSNPRLLSADFDLLWRDRASVALGGAEVPTLPDEILALYLCIHCASHCWERLRWLLDIVDLLSAPGAVALLLRQAQDAGLLAPVQQTVLLAHRWLGLAVDPDILALAEGQRHVAWLEWLRNRAMAGRAWCDGPSRVSRIVWMRLHRYCLRSDWRYVLAEARMDWIKRGEVRRLAKATG